jgi:hypothetical protein
MQPQDTEINGDEAMANLAFVTHLQDQLMPKAETTDASVEPQDDLEVGEELENEESDVTTQITKMGDELKKEIEGIKKEIKPDIKEEIADIRKELESLLKEDDNEN